MLKRVLRFVADGLIYTRSLCLHLFLSNFKRHAWMLLTNACSAISIFPPPSKISDKANGTDVFSIINDGG